MRTLSIAGIACEIFAFSHGSALPIVAHDVLDAGAAGLGALNAAAAFGGTVAVALLAALPGRVRRQPLLGGVFVGVAGWRWSRWRRRGRCRWRSRSWR